MDKSLTHKLTISSQKVQTSKYANRIRIKNVKHSMANCVHLCMTKTNYSQNCNFTHSKWNSLSHTAVRSHIAEQSNKTICIAKWHFDFIFEKLMTNYFCCNCMAKTENKMELLLLHRKRTFFCKICVFLQEFKKK